MPSIPFKDRNSTHRLCFGRESSAPIKSTFPPLSLTPALGPLALDSCALSVHHQHAAGLASARFHPPFVVNQFGLTTYPLPRDRNDAAYLRTPQLSLRDTPLQGGM